MHCAPGHAAPAAVTTALAAPPTPFPTFVLGDEAEMLAAPGRGAERHDGGVATVA